MSKKPAWTEQEAITGAMDVEFSQSQITKLRKIMSNGNQKSQKAKTSDGTTGRVTQSASRGKRVAAEA
jgi:hypothetical protein